MKDDRNETPYSPERAISYDELKTHSSNLDAWISINGIIYDITKFIHKHPMGDTFRGNIGAECGGLFSSAHTNTKVEALINSEDFLRNNNITIVGYLDASFDNLDKYNSKVHLDRIIYRRTHKDEFWMDLKSRVSDYLKDSNESIHYSFFEGISYLGYYLAIYLLLSYLTWVEGSFIASILLGIHLICTLANISHMAAHYGFTKCNLLNVIATHLFDLSGMSGLEWQITHQTHHNQAHSSIDYQANIYDLIGIRIHSYKNRKNFHKYQHIYFWAIVSPYLLFKLFMTTIWLCKHREYFRYKHEVFLHILARLILLAQVVYCASIHGYMIAVSLLIVYSIAYSQTAFILLFNDHEDTHKMLGSNEDVSNFHHKISWAEVQVRTSNNWYPTNWLLSFLEFHYGYFNYHIEHHLFPNFKPRLLKKISPIVKSVCREHNIPYISTPFADVQKSLQRHLIAMGAA